MIALNEAYDTLSEELDKLKVLVEQGEIRPKGKDSRPRPLMFPIFLLGQWGEDLFAGMDEDQAEARYREMDQETIERAFLTGKREGRYGAVSPALLERAKKSGGVFLFLPVKKKGYPRIVETWLPGIKTQLAQKNSVEVTVTSELVQFISAKAVAFKQGPRALRALTSDLTLAALSRANDAGLPTRHVKVVLTYERRTGIDWIVVRQLEAKEGAPKEWTFLPDTLIRQKLHCSKAVVTALAG